MQATSTAKFPQPMRPHGITGRVFGILMERLNRTAYRRAAALVDLPAEGSFLEIGFGTGRLLELVAADRPDGFFAGVDPSPLMLATARRRLDRAHIARDLREGTAERLSWPDQSFDAVAALHSFQFWPDPVSAFGEIRRVLKPGGRFVLILRDHSRKDAEWLPNPWSRSRSEINDALRLLANTGFATRREMPDAGTSAIIVAEAKP